MLSGLIQILNNPLSAKSILFVHHFSGFGGAILSLFSIIERLDPEKFTASVLFLGGRGEGVTFFEENGIKVFLIDGVSTYAHSEGARLKFISRNPFRPITAFFKIYPSIVKVYKFLKSSDFDISTFL